MIYGIIWVICGITAAIIYSNKGHSTVAGFLVGFLLGPIGIILTLVSRPDRAGMDQKELDSGAMKKCPYCAELVRIEATVCRYCQRDLPIVETPVQVPHVAIDRLSQRAYCSACQEYVRKDATACKHCGVTFSTPTVASLSN
jgi:hypothetical protein